MLTHCRKARNLLITQNADSNNEYSTDRVLLNNNSGGNNVNTSGQMLSEEGVLVAAINNLTMTVQEHITSTDGRFETMGEAIAAVGGGFQRNNFGSRGRGGNRNGRSNYSNTGNRGGYNNNSNNNNNSRGNNNRRGRGGRGPTVCYNCGGANHVARDCRARSSGNC